MRLTHAGAVAAAADVSGILVLRAALEAHHPGARLTVVALPGARAALEAVLGLDVVGLSELAEGVHGAPVLLPPAAARALAGPLLLARLLREGAPCALLLAADCDVRAPLVAVEAALDEGDVVVLPRIAGRLPDDGERPDAHDLLTAGELDDEVVAVRAGAAGARCLRWWLDEAVRAVEAGGPAGPGDDRAMPSVLRAAERALPGIAVLADEGCGVSAWNLHERVLTEDSGGTPCAAGRPIALMRFAGFRPDRPWWLAEQASRARVLDDPVLARLCRERAAALRAAGWAPAPRGNHAGPGPLLRDERVRRLVLTAATDLGDLGEPDGEAALLAWLAAPAVAGNGFGINRYTYDLWRVRDDIQRAFPDLDGADGEGFVAWLWAYGVGEAGLDPRLLPPAPG